MWLHVPTTLCRSAPESGDWNSASESLDQMLARYATWRGKSLPPRSWRRVCAMGRYTPLLSGLTLLPSTASRGAESWIASLRATRASPTVSPESSEERTTTAGCSTTSSGSSTRFGLIVSSAKTSLGTRTDSLKPSSQHWREWVTALRLEYSQRAAPEPATSASASSSWPTIRASDGQHGGPGQKDSAGNPGLPGAAATWPAPVVLDRPRSPDTLAKCADFRKRNANQNTVPLYLGEVARDWETPSVAVTAGTRMSRGGERSSELLLTGQAIEVSRWPTPAARDHKGSGTAITRSDGKSRMDMLDWKAERGFSLPPVPMIRVGSKSSNTRRGLLRLWLMSMSRRPSSLKAWVRKVTRPKLNPSFVDWMHGWPSEWTALEPLETELPHWLRRSRGYLSTLLSHPTEGGQRSLFD